jgi:hypothetical protein
MYALPVLLYVVLRNTQVVTTTIAIAPHVTSITTTAVLRTYYYYNMADLMTHFTILLAISEI